MSKRELNPRNLILLSISAICILCVSLSFLNQADATDTSHKDSPSVDCKSSVDYASSAEYTIPAEYGELYNEEWRYDPYTDHKRTTKYSEPTARGLRDNSPVSYDNDTGLGDEDDKLSIIRPIGDTYIDDDGNAIVKDPNDILVLVNNRRNLPADYEPGDLVIPDVSFPFKEHKPQRYMRREAAKALEELFSESELAGIELYAMSGYRPYKVQERIFERECQQKGEKLANTTVAYPGQSEHQTGLAMDITRKSAPYLLDYKFGQTPEGIWLYENCHKYGFIVRYPKDKENITGYSYEPWHIRYVGKDVAQYLYENNLALEELFTEYEK